MTDLRGRTFFGLVAGLNAGQHLAVDALVAFVDGELDPVAQDRAAEHLITCQTCTAEVVAQRQARSVVRSAAGPQVPGELLAALRAIPHTASLPALPDGLAVTSQGAVGAVDPAAPLGATPALGSGPRWGTGPSVLGRRVGRTGASAVVSGLMLGALMMRMLEAPAVDEPGAGSFAETAPLSMTTQPGLSDLRILR